MDRKVKFTREESEKINELFYLGKSYQYIANEINRSRKSIEKYIHRSGITREKNGFKIKIFLFLFF